MNVEENMKMPKKRNTEERRKESGGATEVKV